MFVVTVSRASPAVTSHKGAVHPVHGGVAGQADGQKMVFCQIHVKFPFFILLEYAT